MQVVIAADTHGAVMRLKQLERRFPDASLYLFGGDYGADPGRFDRWIGVMGNNDYDYMGDLPISRVVDAGNHKIYLCHGHQHGYVDRENKIAQAAIELGCDIAVYGHTHVASVHEVDGVTVINPGSLSQSRDGKQPSYCLLNIDGAGITPEIRYWQ